MSTKYIASNWRLPNEENSGKSDNYGLIFDGVANEYIDCVLDGTGGSSSSFGSGSDLDLTISFWFKLSQLTTSFGMLSWATSPAAGGGLLFFVQQTNVGTVRIYIVANVADYRYVSPTLSIDTWYNLTFTRTASDNTWRFYLNSTLDSTTYTDNGSVSGQSSATNFYIGSGFGGSGNFDGSISEVSIFNYALSEPQISTLYGSSSLGAGNPLALKPQPVAYYPLGDNSASNPLTQPNEAVEDASVFDFDGSSNFIDINSLDSSILNSSFSTSIWFKKEEKSGVDDNDRLIDLTVDSNTSLQIITDEATSKFAVNFKLSGVSKINKQVFNSFTSTANEWNQIVLTWDGTSYIYYFNGQPVASTGSTSMSIAGTGFFIGKRADGNSTTFFKGQISNCQFWDTDLSNPEVTTLYNSGVPLTGTQPQAANLKAWYKLDQSANWEADSSGDWQIPDAVSAYPQSFDFVPNDYIDLGNNTSLYPGTGDISYSAWINPSSTTGFKAIFGVQSLSTGSKGVNIQVYNGEIWVFVGVGVNGQWGVNTGGSTGGGGFITSGANLTLNNWHHIAFTFDRDGNGVIYINGLPNRTAAANPNDYSSVDITSTANVFIGRGDGYFDGKISNAQIWNTSLDSSQVETLYNNGTPLTTAIASDNLKAWYKLDNTATFSTNWSIPDASGNGNTGTSSGMTEQNLVNNNVSALNGESNGMTSANLVLSDLTRAVPYENYSMNFDGTGYIETANTFSLLDGQTSASFSMWIKPNAINIFQFLFSIVRSAINTEFQVACYLDTAGRIRVFGDTTILYTYSNTGVVSAGVWTHLCITFDLSQPAVADRVLIYVNGVDETSLSRNMNITQFTTSTSGLSIGRNQNNHLPEFEGLLSQFSVFNSTLTSTEVLKLYSNGVPQDLANFTPAPVAWYPLGSNSFWNGSQWTVRDMIGSNDGTGQNIGVDGLVGDAPRSEANGTGTNMDIESNITGSTKWSSNNSWSINMSSTARVQDTP